MTTLLEPMPPLVLRAWPALTVSDDEFFEFCRQNSELRIEQNRQGEWIIMAPTGGETGSRNSEISRQLGNWARRETSGVSFDSSTGFVLPDGSRRSPDASWVLKSRLAQLTPEEKRRFLPLAPDFALELRSPSDSLADTQDKMTEYRANGVRLGWLVDAAERRVHIYRAGRDVEVLDAPETAAAGPEMVGFVLDLETIWEPGF